MKTGLDRVCADPALMNSWGRFALVTHATSATSNREPCVQALARLQPKGMGDLVCVYGPQHGYWQCEPYNMYETPDDTLDLPSGQRLPLYSLYSSTRQPRPEHLKEVDTIVVDLPDIGCRVYTYMTTLAACLRVAAAMKKQVVVLDRPNPLGLSLPYKELRDGTTRTEGNLIRPDLDSFVGWFRIPMRHGLTLGELGRLFCDQDDLDVNYHVVTVSDLSRAVFPMDDPKITNKLPTLASPNMPDTRSMLLFPVSVALEGTNISEGRGTTAPFQLIGAPFLEENSLVSELTTAARRLNAFESFAFRPSRFMPRFDKYTEQICRGVFIERANRNLMVSQPEPTSLFRSSIALLAALSCSAGSKLQWRAPGYEYNFTDNPLDLILGSHLWREQFETLREDPRSDIAWAKLTALCEKADQEALEFAKRSDQYWLYS